VNDKCDWIEHKLYVLSSLKRIETKLDSMSNNINKITQSLYEGKGINWKKYIAYIFVGLSFIGMTISSSYIACGTNGVTIEGRK